MRRSGSPNPSENGLFFLHTDHLGSTSLLTNESGQPVSGTAVWYFPYGEARPGSGNPPTDYRFTGQRSESILQLYDYGARFYDPVLGRFVSADTVVPEPSNPQALNRFAYVLNNPLKYIDPTGYVYDPSEGNGWQDTLRDHIVLVQGAISGGLDPGFWDPYLKAMEGRLLNQIGDYNGDGHVGHGDWLTWVTGEGHDDDEKKMGGTYIRHVHYRAYGQVGTVEGGRVDLEDYVLRLSAGTGGTIHLIGHSEGGAVILAYVLSRSGAATGHGVRTASLDSATAWVDTSNASAAYQIARKQGVTAATVSNRADTGWAGCAHDQIDGIPHFSYYYSGNCAGAGCTHPLVVQQPNEIEYGDPRSPWDVSITPFEWTMRELGL